MSHNDLSIVRSIVERLAAAGLDVGLFGGWAEELRGLRAPGPHADIDLLLRSPSFEELDALLGARPDLEAIPEKRFSHKRAFVWRGVRVEVFLAQPGQPATSSMFDGRFTVAWPADTFPCEILDGLPVTSRAALETYRAIHAHVARAYQNHLSSMRQRDGAG